MLSYQGPLAGSLSRYELNAGLEHGNSAGIYSQVVRPSAYTFGAHTPR
jgi:hypothetical protein